MATEVAFAKTFLAILDKQPQKITADHVEDPRNYPASTPYTLPRLSTSKPMSKRGSPKAKSTAPTSTSESPSEQPSVKVTIKSPRNPTLELVLPTAQPIATTSMLDIKNTIYEQTCLPVEKLKILYNKKPVADTKTIKDVLGPATAEEARIEFSLMVMGGAATASAAAEALAARQAAPAPETWADADGDTVMDDTGAAPVVAEGSGPSGAAVLQTEEFWEDLKGFLMQRIRDEKLAGELVGKLRGVV
ncbi:Cell-cycle control medial ring component [Rhypophila sp. PSN 637]